MLHTNNKTIASMKGILNWIHNGEADTLSYLRKDMHGEMIYLSGSIKKINLCMDLNWYGLSKPTY